MYTSAEYLHTLETNTAFDGIIWLMVMFVGRGELYTCDGLNMLLQVFAYTYIAAYVVQLIKSQRMSSSVNMYLLNKILNSTGCQLEWIWNKLQIIENDSNNALADSKHLCLRILIMLANSSHIVLQKL